MPESVPNYLTTSPNGDVIALFSGGIQILAGDNQTPPDSRQVQWVRESDGALVAQMGAFMQTPPNNVGSFWRVTKPPGGLGAQSAEVDLSTQLGLTQIDIAAGSLGSQITARLLNSSDHSSFIRCGPSFAPLNEGLRVYGPFQSATGPVGAQTTGPTLGPLVLPETPATALAVIVTYSQRTASPFQFFTTGIALSGANVSVIPFNAWTGGVCDAIMNAEVFYI